MSKERESTGLPPVDRFEMLDVMGGDMDALHTVWRIFLEDAPLRLSSLKEGLRARSENALKQAHTLKGSSETIGAYAFSTLSRKIEQLLKQKDYLAAEVLLPEIDAEFSRLASFIERETDTAG